MSKTDIIDAPSKEETQQKLSNEEIQQIKISTINIRLEAIKDSIKRSRASLFVSTIVSLAILITLWNAYASWYRLFLIHKKDWSVNEVTKFAQQKLVDEWVRNNTISINLLGIRVGISDAAPLASLSLFIINLLFFYNVRRENHAIGSLLIETKKEDPNIKRMIYHAITSNFVFIDMSGNDTPISDLEEERKAKAIPLIRTVVAALAYLPSITIMSIIIADILSVFVLPAPFREGNLPVWNSITGNWPVVLWLLVFEIIAIIFLIVSTILSWNIVELQSSIKNVVSQYINQNKKLEEHLSSELRERCA